MNPPRENLTSHSALWPCRVVGYLAALSAALAVLFGTAQISWASGGTGRVTPFIAALVLGVGLGTIWEITLRHAAAVETSSGMVAVLLSALSATGVGLATGAWLLVSLLGGGLAIQVHQREWLDTAIAAINIVAGNASYEDNMPGYVKTATENLRKSAQREAEGHGPSKKPGEKGVWDEILSGVAALEKIHGNVTGQQANRDEALRFVRLDLQEAESASALFDHARFGVAANNLVEHLNAAINIQLTPSVSGILTGIFSGQGRSLLESTVNGLRDTVADINKKRREVAVPVYRPIDARNAVVEHPSWLVWLIGIAIECSTLCLTLILLALPREPETGETEPAPMLALPAPTNTSRKPAATVKRGRGRPRNPTPNDAEKFPQPVRRTAAR
jgi:hypothetical protein